MSLRTRALVTAALLAVAALATAGPAAADACYDVTVAVNGDAVVDEADCIAL